MSKVKEQKKIWNKLLIGINQKKLKKFYHQIIVKFNIQRTNLFIIILFTINDLYSK